MMTYPRPELAGVATHYGLPLAPILDAYSAYQAEVETSDRTMLYHPKYDLTRTISNLLLTHSNLKIVKREEVMDELLSHLVPACPTPHASGRQHSCDCEDFRPDSVPAQ